MRVCPPGCTCGRHSAATRQKISASLAGRKLPADVRSRMGRRCKPGCTCRRHSVKPRRTPQRQVTKADPTRTPRREQAETQRRAAPSGKAARERYFARLRHEKRLARPEYRAAFEYAMAEPMTSRCATCGFVAEGCAGDVMRRFREHRCAAAA